ncbi:MAG: hypothetical protein IIB55_06550 [Planctomycetes bacterium]|nr:hypothetical protein [Planctomycetota bacterium]
MRAVSTHRNSEFARSGVAVRDALIAVSLALAAVGVTLQSASAQPVRDTPAGRLVTVPERVLVHLDDGRMEVVTRDILLAPGADAATLVPKSVPVFEVDRDGNLSAGAYARNTTGHPVTYMAFEAPQQIRWEQERGYIVETSQMGVLSTHGSMEDGYTWKMRDHLEVHLTPELDLLRGHQNGENTDSAPFQIAMTPDVGSFQLAFPEPDDLVHMNESTERAEVRTQDLLVPDDSPKGGYITSVTPTFTWGPDPQNDKWHLTVFEGLTTNPSAIVLAPRNLTTESYVVPASTPLTDATTYTWLVVGEIIAGYTYSESRTFTVCYADCDQSGTLDTFDFLCFQNAFVQGDPYACDCDPDPVCDTFDFLCFQSVYVAGCP